MVSPFAQSLLVAAIAGVASALMSGLLVRSSAPTFLMSLLAPAPLMIAGFGWHPLAAALGGLVAALLVVQVSGTMAVAMFCGLIALPAFAVTGLSLNRFSMPGQRPARDGKEMGGIGVLLVIFLALIGVLAAMMVEPDFEALTRRFRAAMQAMMQAMTGVDVALPVPRPEALARLYDLLAQILLPMSALVTLLTLTVSATLAAQVAERARLLPYARPDFRRFAVPGGGLILIGLALLVASRPGYLGALGDGVLVGMMFLYVLQGLAVIHVRSLGFPGRGFLLFIVWASLVVFGLPAFLFMLVGLLDHLLDFRRGRL